MDFEVVGPSVDEPSSPRPSDRKAALMNPHPYIRHRGGVTMLDLWRSRIEPEVVSIAEGSGALQQDRT